MNATSLATGFRRVSPCAVLHHRLTALFRSSLARTGCCATLREYRSGSQHRRTDLSVIATTPAATRLIAEYFASDLQPADCYLLQGNVGAGKSYFSRAFVRHVAQDDSLPVPSPTFLLQNIYNEFNSPPIHHFDLYRISQQYELARLNLPASFLTAVCLVEWPERLLGSQLLPGAHLAVHITAMEAAEQNALQQSSAPCAAGSALSFGATQQQLAGGSPMAAAAPTAATTTAHGQQAVPLPPSSAGQTTADAVYGSAVGAAGAEAYSDEEEACSSGDRRWRRIRLLPVGERWHARLAALEQFLQQQGPQLGCYLDAT